jgi:DNA-binding MarR family transcriptional regulator
VSRLTKELSRHRYLRRKPDPTDGRAQLLSPGNRADALRGELYRIQELVNARVRLEIPDADIAHLFEVLSLIEPQG